MKTNITVAYSGYNFNQPIPKPVENTRGYAPLNEKWTPVVYKGGQWVVDVRK